MHVYIYSVYAVTDVIHSSHKPRVEAWEYAPSFELETLLSKTWQRKRFHLSAWYSNVALHQKKKTRDQVGSHRPPVHIEGVGCSRSTEKKSRSRPLEQPPIDYIVAKLQLHSWAMG